jgi:tRNA (guanine37-N1)-methyltransferase
MAKNPQNLKEALKHKLTKKQLKVLPSSFDVVGNIAIFSDFPKEISKKEKLIAETLLKLNKNIKTVTKKTKTHYGKYRLKKVKILAGKRKKTTTHKENGALIKLNIETCYFSPRLGSERLRVAKLVKPGEFVLVLFSGVAPYPLSIIKNSKPKQVYAIELNKNAHKFALENVKLNKTSKVKLFLGDVKNVLPKINQKFDRVIMPLPKDASSYLDVAIKKLNKKAIIHFYDFANENEIPKSSLKKIKEHLKKFKLLKTVKCGKFSPHVYRVCLDLKT